MENKSGKNVKSVKSTVKKFINKKSIGISIVVILVLISGSMGLNHFMNKDEDVKFEVLSEKQVPEKIMEILPRYKTLERALACKVDGEIYIVVTRGEKPTGGYTVNIDKIEKVKEEDRFKVLVYAVFTDPEPGDVVSQAITYPYVIAKTNLKELPYRIELKTRYED